MFTSKPNSAQHRLLLRQLFLPLVLGLTPQACSSSSDSDEPAELVSSWSLDDAGFDGLVPLLEPRISLSLPADTEDTALSPDGSQIAFAQTEENSAT